MALSTADFQRDITFKQSQGHDRIGRLIKFAQDEIHLNGKRIGYVGHGPNESATLLAPVDEETGKAISEAILAKRGTAPKNVSGAPGIPDELADSRGDDE